MENNTVNNPVPEAAEHTPATVFAFAPEPSIESPVDEGNVAVSVDENTQTDGETVESGETPKEGVNDLPTSAPKQKDIGNAFANERRRIEAKYQRMMEEDPYRALGKLMVGDLVETDGISEQDAIQRVQDNFLKAVARRENISPAVAKKLFASTTSASEPNANNNSENQPERDAQRIIGELASIPKPEGFDEATAYSDPAFVELLVSLPPEIAVRLYAAEHRQSTEAQNIAEKLRARQAIPAAMNPQQPVAPVTDWRKADSKQFFAEKERRRKLH